MQHNDGKAEGPVRRAGAKKRAYRKVIGDCDFGDVMETDEGVRYILTADISGRPYGRLVFEDGTEGHFGPLDPSLPMRLV